MGYQRGFPASGVVSDNNSTSVTLGINGVYKKWDEGRKFDSGVKWDSLSSKYIGKPDEVLEYSEITIFIYSEVSSADNGISLEFSSDGVNWDEKNKYTLYGGESFKTTLKVTARYFRVVYDNGSSAQTDFRLQTIYHRSKNEGGDGSSSNQSVSDLPLAAFGEVNTIQSTPIEQIMYVYGIGDKTEVFAGASGSVNVADSLVNCTTGTTIGGYGVARSKRALIYRPGEGAEARFTAIFTTGVANSLQFAGLFSATDAFCFGYDGSNFGILHRYGGALEIQTIQITNSASGAETVTLTLNNTIFSIPVTNGSVQFNAREIGEYLELNTSDWRVDIIDDSVTILAQSVGDKAGTFSISSTGTLTGSFSEEQVGVDNTSDWTYLSSWNGLGANWLDPTKGNVYKIEFQYLGFGAVNFFIEHPDTGRLILIHQLKYTNRNTSTSVRNPSLKCGWASASLGSTTDLSVKGASMYIATQGIRVKREESHSYVNTKNISTTDTNLITIKNLITFNNIPNLSEIIPIILTGASESNKTTIITVVKNATIDGTQNFEYFSEDENIALIDTAGTTYTAGDGKVIATTVISPTGVSPEIMFENLKVVLIPGDTLTCLARLSGGAASDVTISISWDEDL